MFILNYLKLRSFLLAVLLLASHFAMAQSSSAFDYMDKKYESKASARWTLADWLEQKRKVRLMDQWLGMNKRDGNRFEGYLSYDNGTYDLFLNDQDEPESAYTVQRGHLGLFWYFLGISAEVASSQEEFSDILYNVNVRLLGSSVQGTHLMLRYGSHQRKWNEEDFKQNAYGADISIYLMQFFGIEAKYTVYQEAESNLQNIYSGSKTEAGAFFDIHFLRIYGLWFEEELDKTSNTLIESTERRNGVWGGVKLFF